MPHKPQTDRSLVRERKRLSYHREYYLLHRRREGKDIRSTARWQKLRELQLMNYPFCCDPFMIHVRANEKGVVASEVDHIVPISVNPELALDWKNLQSLCVSCHALKSARERSMQHAKRHS